MNTQQLKELAKLADSEVTWILLPKDLANDGWCTEVVNYISVVSPSTITALVDRIEAAERERDELRAEQAEHDEQIARMESKFSLAKRALDSKTARCEKAEAELRRREAAAGEAVAVLYRNGDVLTKAECGEYFEICCKVETPLYTTPPAASVPDVNFDLSKPGTEATVITHYQVPDGWKLVPLKAFPSQWAAGQKAFDAAGINKIDPVYHAMIAAAPAPGGDGG